MDGRLLLIELEDLNPYLSILEVEEKTRNTFLNDMINEFEEMLKAKRSLLSSGNG